MTKRKKPESKQCRTCYNATKGLNRLTNVTKCCGKPQQKSYAGLVTEVSGINIMENSFKELPLFICDACSRKLKAAHAFILQTHEVNERLVAMLIYQEEGNKQLDCLQEAQVDIKSCLEIKVEDDDSAAEYDADVKCQVKLKMSESGQFLQNNLLDVDVLCEINDDKKSDDVQLVTLQKNNNDSKLRLNDIENENNDVILNSSSAENGEIKFSSKMLKDLFQSGGSEFDNGDRDVDLNGDQVNEMDWEHEKKEECLKLNKNLEKKIFKKLKRSKRSEETIVKTAENEDVAVPCTQCNKIFNNSKSLARHQRTSHIPENQKCTCPLCFRKFSRSCNMYTHMRTFHGPDTVPLIRKPSTQERIFQCDKCPRNYTKKKHLNIHIKNKHSLENESEEKKSGKLIEDTKCVNAEMYVKPPNKPKRYEVRSLCSICGSSFSSKTHLVVHMRRHTGERPFKCDLCDRAYPRISELTCHRRIHTGEKPFACKICGKSFRVSSKMTTHMRSHTDIRPYKCAQCERSFKYSKDLSIHFRIHTGERPYSCNVCGSTFRQSNTLKAHRARLSHINNFVENTNNLV